MEFVPRERAPTLESLQVCRAAAATLVVLYHVTNYAQAKYQYTFLGNTFTFGSTGVDFFFVLSGFIICYAHNRDLGAPSTVRRYALKRFIRIYPILWLVTLVKMCLNFVAPASAKPYEQDWSVIVQSLLLIPQVNLPIIGVAWTLSYELLFYALFGVGIVLGGRGLLTLLALWSAAIVAHLAAVSAGIGTSAFPVNFVLNERHLEFLLGCASAYAVSHWRIRAAPGLLALGVAWFALAGLYVNAGGVVYSFSILFGVPSLFIVTGSAALELRRHFRLPPRLGFLGDASYSIYLTHAMFVSLWALAYQRLAAVAQLDLFPATMLMGLLAIGAGSAFYHFVERPLLCFLNTRLVPALRNALSERVI